MDKLRQLQELKDQLNLASKKEVALVIKDMIDTVNSIKGAITRDVREQITGEMKPEMASHMKMCEKMCDSMASSVNQMETSLKSLMETSSKRVQEACMKDMKSTMDSLEYDIDRIREIDLGKIEEKVTRSLNSLQEKVNAIKKLTAEEIRDSLETLKGDERLDKSAIKGLDDLEAKLKQFKGEGKKVTFFGSKGIELYVDGVERGSVRYINFIAGNNITLSYVTVGERSDITITGGGGALSETTVTGTIDDSNVTFTATTEPTYLIINGAMYKKTGGAITWTYVAGTITLSSPVGTGGNIYGLS